MFVVLISFVVTSLLCAAALWTKRLHIGRTAKGHTAATPQSAHDTPTPRLGGLGLLGFFASTLILTDTEVAYIISMLALTALPVFIGGFGEDSGFNISPKTRLWLSFLSALMAGYIFSAWITHTGLPVVDYLLSITVISVLFTLSVSGGISHAINLIDGLNGLALGISLIMTAALGLIALQVGDSTIVTICMIFAAALLGIFIFNFPFGKIFLGDAGAYTIGHVLAWIGILLTARHPNVAPFAIFIVFFWPVADMIFAIIRRIKTGKPIGQPDRMHFHQFVMRALEIIFHIKQRKKSNPIAAVVVWLLASVPVLLGVYFYDDNKLAAILWFACFFGFMLSYVIGIRVAKFLPRHRARNKTCSNPHISKINKNSAS